MHNAAQIALHIGLFLIASHLARADKVSSPDGFVIDCPNGLTALSAYDVREAIGKRKSDIPPELERLLEHDNRLIYVYDPRSIHDGPNVLVRAQRLPPFTFDEAGKAQYVTNLKEQGKFCIFLVQFLIY